ncbi:energy-coupling factor transporter ATPase [Virgibacillus sp. C22-A2]|uniref:Energy-coupling factor transporter ATPase n=1 Tax=Virgibacillus tibetensis TaxID=3042313 RepID=A0ABU6KI48_9BACI|nr:energy-coupling factor transporter ATPase [Virgibacillus sp. C22-A2]
MTPFLKIEQLSLRFETHLNEDTLSNISFEMEHGESILLLGPSGCGKSTLTSCLNGLYPRELDGEMNGLVFINGKKTTDYNPGELSQSVGVVFQDPETQFCMQTVEDEVAFGLENIRIPNELMEDKVDESLMLVDMLPYKKLPIATLSGGQKQKLALACILALEPSLLILDEPTANLDPVATKDLILTIQRLKKKTNCALLIIEHQLDGWTELTERCVLLNSRGEVFYDGSLRKAIKDKFHELESEGIWIPKVTQYLINHLDDGLATVPLTLDDFSKQAHLWIPTEWEAYTQNNYATSEVFAEASDISWFSKKQQIIRNISLNVYQGEFIAIVGANGSGKTSLLRILAGIQKPTSGIIKVKGKSLKNWKESNLRDEIGFVFQNPEHQFITNTVFDEVAFSPRIKGIPEKKLTVSVNAILEVCGLIRLTNEHPYSLSQGQKRRLSVATMIIDNQHMLLLDEPTFGQDAHSNMELMKLLQDRYDRGTTIAMITHDMEIVNQYATRVIVMDNGQLVADCTPDQLWGMPADKLEQWQLQLPLPIQLKRIYEKEVQYVST